MTLGITVEHDKWIYFYQVKVMISLLEDLRHMTAVLLPIEERFLNTNKEKRYCSSFGDSSMGQDIQLLLGIMRNFQFLLNL